MVYRTARSPCLPPIVARMASRDDIAEIPRPRPNPGSRDAERLLERLKREAVTELVGVLSGFWSSIEEQVRLAALAGHDFSAAQRSEEHTSELQSRGHLVCRLL